MSNNYNYHAHSVFLQQEYKAYHARWVAEIAEWAQDITCLVDVFLIQVQLSQSQLQPQQVGTIVQLSLHHQNIN